MALLIAPFRRIRWLLALALLLQAYGCAHLEPVERPPEKPEAWNQREAEYTLLPGDELDIKLLYNPEFSDRVIVAPDGLVHLDLIGAVNVLDKTPGQVAEDVRQRYARELRHPDVNVTPRIFGSQAIFVAGEVNKPGMLKLAHGMSVLQGVMEAGGLLETANLEQIILLRRTPRNTSMLKTLNLKDILEGKTPAADIPLHRFDVVFVPRSDIAEADVRVSQYVDKLIPMQRQLFIGYYPGLVN